MGIWTQTSNSDLERGDGNGANAGLLHGHIHAQGCDAWEQCGRVVLGRHLDVNAQVGQGAKFKHVHQRVPEWGVNTH